jgi:hypothetical protein
LETFTEPREFVDNDHYDEERQNALADPRFSSIDEPIVDLVSGFSALPHCFPLQSCVGHFLWVPRQDIYTLDPIPTGYAGPVRYRIAYIALCIENSARGERLRQSLAQIPAIDPAYIQFGSADWFWERWVNSYALQVEPISQMMKDEAILEVEEALHIQKTRDLFFAELRRLLRRELGERRTS